LLLAGCVSSVDQADITRDPCAPLLVTAAADATDSERESVADAVALWNGAAHAQLALTGGDEGEPTLEVRFRPAPLAFLGIYEAGTVIVNRDLTDPGARTIVVAHEIGHAFGLVHTSAAGSVMAPGNMSIAPGAPDVAALVSRWGACP
jgi:hypothetical protein